MQPVSPQSVASNSHTGSNCCYPDDIYLELEKSLHRHYVPKCLPCSETHSHCDRESTCQGCAMAGHDCQYPPSGGKGLNRHRNLGKDNIDGTVPIKFLGFYNPVWAFPAFPVFPAVRAIGATSSFCSVATTFHKACCFFRHVTTSCKACCFSESYQSLTKPAAPWNYNRLPRSALLLQTCRNPPQSALLLRNHSNLPQSVLRPATLRSLVDLITTWPRNVLDDSNNQRQEVASILFGNTCSTLTTF